MNHITSLLLALLFTAGATSDAAAQTGARSCGDTSSAAADADRVPCRIETSVFAAVEAPTIFSDVKVRSTDLIEASLSVENKGGTIAYAPFLYGLSRYRPLASEIRFRLVQKDNLTTFGIGTQYNPLSPRGARGKREWARLGGTKPPLETLRVRLGARKESLEKELETLRDEYRNVSTFKDGMTAEQLTELRRRQVAIADSITAKQAELRPVADEMASLEAAEMKVTAGRIQSFYTKLLDTRTPVIAFGYSATAFPLLGGSSKDADEDGANDVEYQLKKHSLTASVDWRLARRFQLGGLVTREWDRASAEAGAEFADMTGFGVSAGGIVAILDKAYEQSAAFKEGLFIPSVVVGGAVEYRSCGNAEDTGVSCPDSLERLVAVTPFVDLRVTKTIQFRIGAPLKFSTPVGGGSATDLGVVTAFALQLGEPK